MRVRRRFRFEAAHRLPRHPGKCGEMHGHSYVLRVTVDRPVAQASGMAIDFSDLKQVVPSVVVERMDHRCLNDLLENPTAEHLVEWIWNALVEPLPGLVELELYETVDCSVIYRGP